MCEELPFDSFAAFVRGSGLSRTSISNGTTTEFSSLASGKPCTNRIAVLAKTLDFIVSHSASRTISTVPGDGGHHEEMDRTTAGLEHDPRTSVDLLRRAHARITPPYPDVKGKGCKHPGFAVLDIRFRRRYGREKAVSVRPLPPHTRFCCLHSRRTFTQNSG